MKTIILLAALLLSGCTAHFNASTIKHIEDACQVPINVNKLSWHYPSGRVCGECHTFLYPPELARVTNDDTFFCNRYAK